MSDFTDKSIDELFAHYRVSGRPRLLAEVFDRTAPELLRLAMHLARDPAQAEDLVQSTFVEAIRCARRFTPGRRVQPWLSGILANIARDQRRQERPAPADAGAVTPPTDPATAAEDAELQRRIDDEIERLAEPYRTVLLLHLQHGLAPAEIARVLSRSPGTVRSQLTRARDQLRERLPRSYAQGFALALASGRGLDDVRACVLREAYVAVPGFALTTGIGLLAGHKVAVGILAAVALVGWVLTRGNAVPPLPEMPGAASARVTDERKETTAPPRDSDPRAALGMRRGTDTRKASLAVHVTHGGMDLAGVGVRLRAKGGDGVFSERARTTDARGTAHFDELEEGTLRIELDRGRGPLVSIEGEDQRVEIELGAGVNVRGTVRDLEGRAVPGASIWLAYEGHAALGAVAAQADERGHFELRGVERTFFAAAFAPGFRPSALAALSADEELQLTLANHATIVHGRVQGQDGEPIRNALVRFGREVPPFHLLDPEGGPLRPVTNDAVLDTRTDADGYYRFEHAAPGSVEVFVRAAGRWGERRSVSLQAGTANRYDFVLRTGARVHGTVHDSGRPLQDAYIVAGPRELGTPTWFVPSSRTDVEGRFELRGVRPGLVRANVYTAATGATKADLEARTDRDVRTDIDIGSRAAVTGRVLGADGQPRSGLWVRTERDSEAARTGKDGRFRLLVAPDETHDLVVADPQATVPAPLARVAGVTARSAPYHIQLAPGAEARSYLTGEVLPADATSLRSAFVRLRHESEPRWIEFPVDDASGAFRAGPLVPGRYELRAGAPERVVTAPLLCEAVAEGDTDVGSLLLARGGSLVFELPGDSRIARGRMQMCVRDLAGNVLLERALADLTRPTPLVPAGPVEVTLWGSRFPIVQVRAEIESGATTSVEIPAPEAPWQTFTLRRPARAEPVAGDEQIRVRWFIEGREVASDDHFLTNARELVVARPFCRGAYSMRVRTASGLIGEAAFDVAGPAQLDVQLAYEDRQFPAAPR